MIIPDGKNTEAFVQFLLDGSISIRTVHRISLLIAVSPSGHGLVAILIKNGGISERRNNNLPLCQSVIEYRT